LEQALQVTRKELVDVSANTQADLDRFQRQKIRDLRDMLIAYAKVHVKYCEKVMYNEFPLTKAIFLY
jgi:hypothetical protein